MNIVFIGMRGSGKTVLGEAVAERLGIPLLETDKLVEQDLGAPIGVFVNRERENNGVQRFRESEARIIQRVTSENDNVVISTGGGAIEKEENRIALKRNSLIFYLEAEAETLAQRVLGDRNRFLLTRSKNRLEETRKLLKDRDPIYRELANYVIYTGKDRTVEEEVDEILKKVEEAKNS